MTTQTKRVDKRLRESARTDSRRIHITPRTNGWAVRKEGNLQASAVKPTQREAISLAKELATSGKASVIIVHSKSGRFRAVSASQS